MAQLQGEDFHKFPQHTYIFQPSRRLIVILAVCITCLNLGISEYASVPSFGLALLAIVSIQRRHRLVNERSIQTAIAGTLISSPIFFLQISDNGNWHGLLAHSREFFFLLLIISLCEKNQSISFECRAALIASSYLIVPILAIQSIQIWLNTSVTTLPQSWFMIDYGNSIQTLQFAGYTDYLRPPALYSEPSVVASVLLPALYLSLKQGTMRSTLLICVGLVLTKSLLGIGGMAALLTWSYSNTITAKTQIAVVASVFVLLIAGNRIEDVLAGEDMSAQWRFLFPLEYLRARFTNGEYWPTPIQSIHDFSERYFEGASITDTWAIFTVAHLGLLGLLWIPFVISQIPSSIRMYFLYLGIISGAPLYPDKALLMVLTATAILHTKQRNGK